MTNAWNALHHVRALDLPHRKGWRPSEATPQMAIDHALSELAELESSPNDMDELADVLVVLLHYAQIQGWQLIDLEDAMVRKIEARFG